jgi:hypothetical protein
VQSQYGPLALGDDLLVVGVDHERKHRAVRAERRLDHVRRVTLAVLPDPFELCAGPLGVLGEVVVAAVGDALELRPADREEVLDVACTAGVMRELVGVVRAHA